MNTTFLRAVASALLLATFSSTAAILYVDVNSTNPIPPYTNWATAANVIQDAVDAAATNDTVLVGDGVYTTGERLVFGTVPFRVAVEIPLEVRSVNGPGTTIIEGHEYQAAVRCVYLASNASFLGFTVTNGQADPIYSETDPENQQGGGIWCESTSAFVSNCVVVACSVGENGGGVFSGTLDHCTLLDNFAGWRGGGAFGSILHNCILLNNTAAWAGYGAEGGGACNAILNNCYLEGNSSELGGGASGSTLNNCTLAKNSAGVGGGTHTSTNRNCIVYHNSAASGPNWFGGTLDYCCTLPLPGNGSGNITNEPAFSDSGHITAGSPCRGAGLVAYVVGADIDNESWLNPPSMGCDEYTPGGITGPLSVEAQANHTNVAPGFVISISGQVNGHALSNRWQLGDGTEVNNRFELMHSYAAVGDYSITFTAFNEDQPTGVSATVPIHVEDTVHYVALSNQAPSAPFDSWATAATNIQDAVDATATGGLILVSNGVYATGGRVLHGAMSNRVAVSRPMTLQSVNGPEWTVIRGNQVPGTITGDGAVRCIYLADGATLIGFTLTNGASRAVGDYTFERSVGGAFCESTGTVLSNCWINGNRGHYTVGGILSGTLYHCVVQGNSVDAYGYFGGASGTDMHDSIVAGNTAYNGAGVSGGTLNRCTVTNNSAGLTGGGAKDATLNHCLVAGNYGGNYGGGGYSCTFNNCLVISNSSRYGGGGADAGVLNHCTVVGNSSGTGGGTIWSQLSNSIVYYNIGGNQWGDYPVDHSCTVPLSSIGTGSITNPPIFVNQVAGDYRLNPNSPCINAGDNASSTVTNDFDDNPRIAGGRVDMGAYEFQSPQSVISYAYLQQYGLPTDGSVDFADGDNDKATTWQEWKAWTDPTDGLSVLRLLTPQPGTNGIVVPWQSVAGHTYLLERADHGTAAFTILQSEIEGQAGTTSFTDTTATNGESFLYRVAVPE